MAASIRGMGTLLRRLRELPSRVNSARNEALEQWAKDLEKTAKDLAPVRTGNLRDRIESKINYTTGRAWIRIAPDAGIGGDYPYWVEKGTSKMEAQPFLGPAAQIHRRTGERALRRAAPRFLGRW